MANPTRNYGWVLPQQNQNPWFRGISQAFQYVDSTLARARDDLYVGVGSIQAFATARATLAISWRPGLSSGAGMIIGSHSLGTNSGWIVCSAQSDMAATGSIGIVGGSFALVNSGAHAFVTLDVIGYCSANSQVVAGVGGCTVQWRLVLERTGVTSLTLPVDQLSREWKFPLSVTMTHIKSPRFTCIASLGPGKYSIHAEALLLASASSLFILNRDDMVTCVVQEVVRP